MDFKTMCTNLDISLTNDQLCKFENYFKLLVEWNEKINLTSIVEENDVYLKHFYDSLTLYPHISKMGNIELVDIGAGAGFPSIPNAIVNDNINVTIIDSLNKRIKFLEILVKELNLKNVTLIHGRAEEKVSTYREKFDIVTARAVSRLNKLSELCIPYVKVGGYFISMKAALSDTELSECTNAFEKLRVTKKHIDSFILPIENSERNIIVLEKVDNTPLKYPRSFGKIKNSPL